MEYKDLLTIYITILIGGATIATIIVTLLKEELFGKSFHEVINRLEKDKPKKTWKYGWHIGLNLFFYVLLLLIGIFADSGSCTIFNLGQVLKWLLLLEKVLLILVIIHLTVILVQMYGYFYDVYDKMIQIKLGENKGKKTANWERLVVKLIAESTNESDYNIIEKNIGDINNENLKSLAKQTIFPKDIQLDDYQCKKRNVILRKYLEVNTLEGGNFSKFDFKLLGYLSDDQEIFGKIENPENQSAYISGFIEKIRFLLRNKKSIYEIEQKIMELRTAIDGSSNDEKKQFLTRVLFTNMIQYPEFVENDKLCKGMKHLMDESKEGDVGLEFYFQGYRDVVKDNLLIEINDSSKKGSLEKLTLKEFDLCFEGRECGYSYLYQIGKTQKNNQGDSFYNEYAKKMCDEVEKLKEIISLKNLSEYNEKKENILSIIDKRIPVFDSEIDSKIRSNLKSNLTSFTKEDFKSYKNIKKLVYEIQDIIELILYQFSTKNSKVEKTIEVNEVMESESRTMKIADNGFTHIRVTSGKNPKGIRFFKPNKEETLIEDTHHFECDHIYFAGDNLGNAIGSQGIILNLGNEERNDIKIGRVSNELLKELGVETLEASEILKSEELQEKFSSAIKEVLSASVEYFDYYNNGKPLKGNLSKKITKTAYFKKTRENIEN